MNEWRIWVKFKDEWRQSNSSIFFCEDGGWYISTLSPSIPVPYSVLWGCMEWLRKQHIPFFVEWL
jgi:hypothetical protein